MCCQESALLFTNLITVLSYTDVQYMGINLTELHVSFLDWVDICGAKK